jgi:hypothetical protein
MKSGTLDRLWKLAISAFSLILEGKREPDSLVDFLQKFVFGTSLGKEVWAEAYKLLGMEAEFNEFTKVGLPESEGLWTVPVLQGVTCNKVVEVLRKLGVQVYLYAEDLDKEVTVNDRDPSNGSYTVSFRCNVEADEEFKNLSANQLKEQNHKGITLLERLLLELAYFMATGKHLDVQNVTLCSGSRYRNGRVPSVRFFSGSRGVDVRWYDPGYHDGHLRSRSVVS